MPVMGKKAKQKTKKKQTRDKGQPAPLKLAGVLEKVAKLAGTTRSLKVRQKGLKKQRKVLQKQYAALAARCQGVEREGEILLQSLSRLQLENQEMEARLSLEQDHAAQAGERLDSLESAGENDRAQVRALHQQLEQQRPLVERVRDRLDALESLIADLSDELKTVVSAAATAEEAAASDAPDSAFERLDGGNTAGERGLRLEDIGHLRMRVDILEGHLVDLDAKGSASAQALEALQAQCGQPASLQVDRLSEQIEALEAGRAELASRIGRLATDVSELGSGNSDLGSDIAALSTRLDQTSRKLEEISAQDRLCESWIERLKQADSDLSQRIDQQQRQVQGLVERLEALDKTARDTANSWVALQQQIAGLEEGLTAAELRLTDKNEKLEKQSQHLDSEYRQLAARHGRLFAGVLAVGALLLILGGIGYWAKFSRVGEATTGLSQRVEQISQQLAQQQQGWTDQEQRFAALQEEGKRRRAQAETKQRMLREMIGNREATASEQADRLARIEADQGKVSLRLDQFGQDQDRLRQQLQGLLDLQGDLSATLVRLEREGGEARRLLAALVAERAEQQASAEQQQENPGSSNRQPPEPPAQTVAADARASTVRSMVGDWSSGDGKRYTIQIVAAYDAAVVARVAARQDLQQARAIYRRKFNQKDWYMLLYGRFSSAGKARSVIRDLPQDIRAYGAWVRNLATIEGVPVPDSER